VSSIPAESLNLRVPSWSWISVDGEVEWEQELYWEGGRDEEIKVYCNITECECIPAGQSLTGEVVSGYIKMECFMLQGFLLDTKLTVGDLPISYHADNRSLKGDGVVHLIKMALLWNECLLVLRLVDPIQQSYQRIGYASVLERQTGRFLAWPSELKIINLV